MINKESGNKEEHDRLLALLSKGHQLQNES